MNFGFTAEQDMLRSEVRKFLAERCPLAAVRRIGGGTPNIQKNIIAERLLGLPKD
ncbi:MAG: acyl-CoA dehydrogenase [Deltaproteobacteria bacterium]|nr:acyl-CoA dehydrogenase [Deltaproteobacteria bacterium]MBW2385882.1 acyl-CoA dehydrogenase [Deltaproteobacteria bacterium]MBW2696170.1 acyl-CoA dehydrogenase [Deltaproteobacteria bacterium]